MKKISICFVVLAAALCVLTACRQPKKPEATVPTESHTPTENAGLAQSDPENLYKRFIANEITALDETNVKKYFRDYLLWDVDVEDYTYTYLDVTGDGVPELCVRQYPEMYFFTVKNGEISHWYTEHNSYVKLLNNGALLFERHGGAPTHINYEYYELDENAKIKRKATFSWWDGGTIEIGKVYPDTYIFDDKEVTKEEYEEKTRPYLSVGCNKLVWYDKDGKKINEKTKEVLQKVLNKEQSFTFKSLVFDKLTEENLENFAFASEGSAWNTFVPVAYTYVDFDADGIEEMLIADLRLHFFLTLRYDNGKVNGYVLENLSPSTIKTDGSFLRFYVEGAETVSRVKFNGVDCELIALAHRDMVENIYEFNGKTADKAEVESYIEDWKNSGTNVAWTNLPHRKVDEAQNKENVAAESVTQNLSDNDASLLDVLYNRTVFADETGKTGYLKDYKVRYKYPEDISFYEKNSIFTPSEYTFVDLDKDGQNELVISELPEGDTYLILHKSNDAIYGYCLYTRWFQSLKTDGTFRGTGGASCHNYNTISFNKNTYRISTFATYIFTVDGETPASNQYGFAPDCEKSVFEINGKAVSFETIDSFAEEWNKRPGVNWIKFA